MTKMQKMERTYKYAVSMILIVIGFLCLVTGSRVGGTHFEDFVSGVLCGLSAGLLVTGIVGIILSFMKGR